LRKDSLRLVYGPQQAQFYPAPTDHPTPINLIDHAALIEEAIQHARKGKCSKKKICRYIMKRNAYCRAHPDSGWRILVSAELVNNPRFERVGGRQSIGVAKWQIRYTEQTAMLNQISGSSPALDEGAFSSSRVPVHRLRREIMPKCPISVSSLTQISVEIQVHHLRKRSRQPRRLLSTHNIPYRTGRPRLPALPHPSSCGGSTLLAPRSGSATPRTPTKSTVGIPVKGEVPDAFRYGVGATLFPSKDPGVPWPSVATGEQCLPSTKDCAGHSVASRTAMVESSLGLPSAPGTDWQDLWQIAPKERKGEQLLDPPIKEDPAGARTSCDSHSDQSHVSNTGTRATVRARGNQNERLDPMMSGSFGVPVKFRLS
jgi:hypothetical protein